MRMMENCNFQKRHLVWKNPQIPEYVGGEEAVTRECSNMESPLI